MEVKNIHTHAGWFQSYMDSVDGSSDQQGYALVGALRKKVEQLEHIIEQVKEEVEMSKIDRVGAESAIKNIKYITRNIPQVEVERGYFKWIG